MRTIGLSIALCLAVLSSPANARDLEVKITDERADSTVQHGEEQVKVWRDQDTADTLESSFTETSRPCPPFCVNPLQVAEGVETVAEQEVIKFMETEVYRGDGLMIDTRTPSWHHRGTIPGSHNIPFTVFEKPADDPELAEVLESLGARERGDVGKLQTALESFGLFGGDQKTERWDFTEAKEILLWCNGPWCGQTPRAIKALISMGYPTEKLKYYRGGMQMWQSLGLTTVLPSEEAEYASR